MKLLKACSLFLCLVLLSACADRSGCPADLREAGEQHARLGAKPELPNERCELNAEERETYFAGRAVGLKWFCDDQRLFEEALQARAPELKYCPLDYADDAVAAQRTGEEIRKAQEAATREQHVMAQLLGTDPRGSSEAGLRVRTAEAELEQLRALAITRGWLVNPAISGILPNIPDAIAPAASEADPTANNASENARQP